MQAVFDVFDVSLILLFQLDPPPSEPVYLIAERGIHLYLREYANLEDIGLLDQYPAAVKPVFAEELHWRFNAHYQRNEQNRELNALVEAQRLDAKMKCTKS